jgi:hypothetical protein
LKSRSKALVKVARSKMFGTNVKALSAFKSFIETYVKHQGHKVKTFGTNKKVFSQEVFMPKYYRY